MLANQAESPAMVTQSASPDVRMASAPASSTPRTVGSGGRPLGDAGVTVVGAAPPSPFTPEHEAVSSSATASTSTLSGLVLAVMTRAVAGRPG